MAAGAATEEGRHRLRGARSASRKSSATSMHSRSAPRRRTRAPRCKIVWTNAWYSPPKETAAAKALVASGADVLGQNVDSPAAGVYAESKGIPWVGYDANAKKFAPKQWLTAAVYDWGPYYAKRIQAAIDGTWKPGFYYGSINDGFTSLAPFGPKVSAKTKAAIAAKMAAIKSGKFDVFYGPDLRPERQAEGACRDDAQGAARPVLDAVAGQGRGRIRLPRSAAGLARWGIAPPVPFRQGGAPVIPAPLLLSRCAGSPSAFPASWQTTTSPSRRLPARCTRCSARTARARAPSRTS